MSRVTIDITISLDGFIAGPNQSVENPIGENGDRLHRWMFEAAAKNASELEAITSSGAYIMGRNMFGPIRDEWALGDDGKIEWNGWWGPDPPYHAPVFVLTNHPRAPLVMRGGTTLTFVTEGITQALAQAIASSPDGTVSIAGGASTARQYLQAGLVDALRLHLAPVLLGTGERLFDGLNALNLQPLEARATALVTHLAYRVIP
jgi:dihydrofolate reductase